MPRTIEDLEANAIKFWPSELAAKESEASILPSLVQSQEKFISILYVADSSPTAWKAVLSATLDMPANLFLKHLSVLSDVGGEKFQRIRRSLNTFFPGGRMAFRWKEGDHSYDFQSLSAASSWSNKHLGIDGRSLQNPQDLGPIHEDVAMLLLHGGSSPQAGVPEEIVEKCILGSYLGQKKELDFFVRQRYLFVSRITGGAKSNAMGHLAQGYVREHLEAALPGWDLSAKTIPGISQNAGATDMTFDMVARSPSQRCCAIEVSFQVTTNSVIERKAGQARGRQQLLHNSGHRIAYVIDGAGNMQRESALRVINDHSDCTVTFKSAELDSLVLFLKGFDGRGATPRKKKHATPKR